eukprot:1472322-Alexandrium_andersonii.AAC.1
MSHSPTRWSKLLAVQGSRPSPNKSRKTRNMRHLPMSQTGRGRPAPPPQRPFRALSGPPPDWRHAMGQDEFT